MQEDRKIKRLDKIPYCNICKKSTENSYRFLINSKMYCPDCMDKYLNKK
jgi:hypothetical protein